MYVSMMLRMVQEALFAEPQQHEDNNLYYPSTLQDTFATEHSSFSYHPSTRYHLDEEPGPFAAAETHALRQLNQQGNAAETNNNNDDDTADAHEPNKLGTALSYIFLFFLIFGLSATVELRDLKRQLQNKFAIATGVAMQFVIMPVLGFLAVIALKPQPGWTQPMGVALLVVTSSPGGSYSNWWCSLFNADLALSVAMTTVSSLLSTAMLPLNLFFYTFLAYGTAEEESVVEALDFGTIFLALGVVLFAILAGLLAGYRYDNRSFHVLANRLGSLSGVLLVLFSLFLSSGADGAENSFWNQDWAFYIGVAFPCLVGISLANIIARSLRLAPPETVAISIECCYQNTGIATSVAIAMYDDKEERAQAVAVPLFYGVVEAVAIAIYCVWAWKVGWTKAPPNERLCTVLTKTYEGLENEENDDEAASRDNHSDDGNSADHSSDLRSDHGRARLDSGMTDLQSLASSRFADEESMTVAGTTTVGSTEEISPTHGGKRGGSTGDSSGQRPFWRRWFGFGSGAGAATAAAHRRRSSSHKQNQLLGHDEYLEPLHEEGIEAGSSELMMVTTGSGVSSSKTIKRASSLPSSSEKDKESKDSKQLDSSSCHAPQRGRSYTVETSTSSGPPTTPAGRRDLQVIESEDADEEQGGGGRGRPVSLQDLAIPDTTSPAATPDKESGARTYSPRSSRKKATEIVSELADVI